MSYPRTIAGRSSPFLTPAQPLQTPGPISPKTHATSMLLLGIASREFGDNLSKPKKVIPPAAHYQQIRALQQAKKAVNAAIKSRTKILTDLIDSASTTLTYYPAAIARAIIKETIAQTAKTVPIPDRLIDNQFDRFFEKASGCTKETMLALMESSRSSTSGEDLDSPTP
jgi:hypothetical protein